MGNSQFNQRIKKDEDIFPTLKNSKKFKKEKLNSLKRYKSVEITKKENRNFFQKKNKKRKNNLFKKEEINYSIEFSKDFIVLFYNKINLKANFFSNFLNSGFPNKNIQKNFFSKQNLKNQFDFFIIDNLQKKIMKKEINYFKEKNFYAIKNNENKINQNNGIFNLSKMKSSEKKSEKKNEDENFLNSKFFFNKKKIDIRKSNNFEEKFKNEFIDNKKNLIINLKKNTFENSLDSFEKLKNSNSSNINKFEKLDDSNIEENKNLYNFEKDEYSNSLKINKEKKIKNINFKKFLNSENKTNIILKKKYLSVNNLNSTLNIYL